MSSDFGADYAAALRSYLESHSDQDLTLGRELGRRALHNEISMLAIIETHELAAWMQDAALPDERIADIVLAVNEACANSIEHGYRGSAAGRVRVEGENDGARVHLTIIDDGSWQPKAADPGLRGRGLLLIRAVSDWLEMECTASGTTVDMSFNVSA